MTKIVLTKLAKKQLSTTPVQVQSKFSAWVMSVTHLGIRETRRYPSFHDEALKGQRVGQRSIRLNRQWRAIYIERQDGAVEFLTVEEVTPHDYR